MRRDELEALLFQYDQNKGPIRRYVSDRPEIIALRAYIEEIISTDADVNVYYPVAHFQAFLTHNNILIDVNALAEENRRNLSAGLFRDWKRNSQRLSDIPITAEERNRVVINSIMVREFDDILTNRMSNIWQMDPEEITAFRNELVWLTNPQNLENLIRINIDTALNFDTISYTLPANVGNFLHTNIAAALNTIPSILITSEEIEIPPNEYHQKLDEIDFKGDIDERFICSISQDIMVNPVYHPNRPQVVYDYPYIAQWLKNHDSCPSTRILLTIEELVSSLPLRREITQFIESQVSEHSYKSARQIVPMGYFDKVSIWRPATPQLSTAMVLSEPNSRLMSK